MQLELVVNLNNNSVIFDGRRHYAVVAALQMSSQNKVGCK